MRSTPVLLLVLIGALAAPALAQSPPAGPPAGPPTRVRGTIEKFDDHTLVVKGRDGASTTVTLAPDFTVRAVVAKTLDDIKPGDKIGITSVKAADNLRQAVEIHIFPASMTNVRMIQVPWDLGHDSLMTNAPVVQVTSAPQGRMIRVAVNGKESEIAVPPDTPIVTYGPGDPGLLKPGAAVFVFARKQPDGSLTAPGVTAEKDGVKPPM